MRMISSAFLATVLSLATLGPAMAWGADGHRLVSGIGAALLPDSVPAFVRTPAAVEEIRILGTEADRLKGAGKTWDADEDPGHYLDLGDDGTIAGVPLAHLPASREAYDTALRAGTYMGRPANEYAVGYLPYSIVDGWETVMQDFAIWRVARALEQRATTPKERAVFTYERTLRETLTIRDIGYWSHFVGDGSQPLHVSAHFNGWGPYPNPQNYSTSNKLHAYFETTFVHAVMNRDVIAKRVGPYVPGHGPFIERVEAYLAQTASYAVPLYQLDARNAFVQHSPEAIDFTFDRLAAGAQALRDWTADAYAASESARVGYPGVRVRDVENGTATISTSAFGE